MFHSVLFWQLEKESLYHPQQCFSFLYERFLLYQIILTGEEPESDLMKSYTIPRLINE